MKKITIFLFIFLNQHSYSGDRIGGGGGVILLNNLQIWPQQKKNVSPTKEIKPDTSFQLKEIDNIEIGDQVKYPESPEAKIKFLKRKDLQSIQMINGIILLNE